MAYKDSQFSYKLRTKYDINAPNFMSREHAFCVSSNTIFGLKVIKTWHFSTLVTRLRFPVQCEVHFKIFCKQLFYNPFIIIMCYNLWRINFNYMTCHQKERWWKTVIKLVLKRLQQFIFWKKKKKKGKREKKDEYDSAIYISIG